MDDDLKSPMITNSIIIGTDSDGYTTVNQYSILKNIGEGSYGKVKLCRSNNTYFAVKVIYKALLRKKREIHRGPDGKVIVRNALEDIAQEVAIMKKLKHQNIVKLREVIDDEESDKMYLIMVYCAKGSLLEWDEDTQLFYSPWNDNAPLREKLILKIFRDILCGLEYLHYHNIIHRDLKPQNIMLTDTWQVKIGDFGQATIFEGNDQQNKKLGTFQFFPPECCGQGGKEFSGKLADIWALGLILYALIYKKLPYTANTIMEIFEGIQAFELVFDPPINPDLERLIRRLLDKNPETRIQLYDIFQEPWICEAFSPLSPTHYDRIVPTNEEILQAVRPKTSIIMEVIVM